MSAKAVGFRTPCLVGETLSEEEQAAAHAASRAMLLELNLRQIREKVSELSQEEVARLLEVTQPYISKLERQQDMLVSKLYDYVATLGGQVEIRAKFWADAAPPDGRGCPGGPSRGAKVGTS